MILVSPMTAEHVRGLMPQPLQSFESPADRVDFAMEYAAAGPAFAAIAGDSVICVGGTVQVWPGRGIAWSLIAANAGPYMVGLTRAVRRVLEAPAYRRLEMCVDAEHEAAARWARLLGFDLETPKPMRAFTPAGRAAYLYGRVRE